MIDLMPRPETAPILVVDDDPKIVALVRTYLERERYRVVTAGDGRAALRAIEEHAPRLVVLDLMLPEVDGLAVIRRARAMGDIPILVLSARGLDRRPDPGPERGRRRLPAQAVLAGRARRPRPDDPAADGARRPRRRRRRALPDWATSRSTSPGIARPGGRSRGRPERASSCGSWRPSSRPTAGS